MKIVCVKRKDAIERDPLLVEVRPPEDHPGSKQYFKFPLNEPVDLDQLVKERGLKWTTGDDLAHQIMGDKRYKGLFKIHDGTATKVSTPKTATKPAAKTAATKAAAAKSLKDYQNKSTDTATEAG